MSESNDNGFKYLRPVGNHWRQGIFLWGAKHRCSSVRASQPTVPVPTLGAHKFLFLAWLIVIDVTG